MNESTFDIATAYHEAGHAVIAMALGRSVQCVSVIPNEQRLGICEFKKGASRRADDRIEAEILILLAGMAAEAMQTGEYGWDEAGQDLRHARVLTLRRGGSPTKAERLERRLLDKVEHLLSQPGHRRAVETIAEELRRNGRISGRAARHHFELALASDSQDE